MTLRYAAGRRCGRVPTFLIVAAALLAWPRAALALRSAVVVGNNAGTRDEPHLLYAEDDARRIAQVLTTVGDFAPENTVLLEGRSVAEILQAIRRAEERLTRSGEDGLLLFYYSGHADSAALHIGNEELPLRDLQEMVGKSAIATRVMIIDACRSGTLTQTKGGHPAAGFAIEIMPTSDPHGAAIITSSAAGEDSQESDELHASFFTHHFATGLLGAADGNGDGAVTLAEVFAYSAGRTLAATTTTAAGPQHPTFKVDLGGREELVLTRPGRSGGRTSSALVGHLDLRHPGWYFIRRANDGVLIAEVTIEAAGRVLALPAGRYEVLERSPDYLLDGTFSVSASTSTMVSESDLRRIDFGRVVRKGGTRRTRAFGVFAEGGLRGSLLGLGAAPTAGVGARLDFTRVSLLMGIDLAESSIDNSRGTALETSELQLHVALFKAFDASTFTWWLGGEVGVSRLLESTIEQSGPVESYALSFGPSAALEVPFWHRYFIWVQASVPAYFLDATAENRLSSGRSLRLTYRCLLAMGGYL